MKIDGHGKSETFSTEQIQDLITDHTIAPHHRCFIAIAYYTCGRVSEVLAMKTVDVYDKDGSVRSKIIYRKNSTKGKLGTRTLPVHPNLRAFLEGYYPIVKGKEWLISSDAMSNRNDLKDKPLTRFAIHTALTKIFDYRGYSGFSSHGFRRSILTNLHDKGNSIRSLMAVSGHQSLDGLKEYLDVSEDAVHKMIGSL